MENLTKHTTVQSKDNFEKDTRNGKRYIASAHQYLKFFIYPVAYNRCVRAQLRIFTSTVSCISTTFLCATKHILNLTVEMESAENKDLGDMEKTHDNFK